MKSEELIDDLIERTRQNINDAESLKQSSYGELNSKPDEDTWSALECIEHLNFYGQFYIPEIDKRIKATKTVANPNFKSGWLGNYFAKSMLPKEKLNKMKTFANMNPNGNPLSLSVLDEFLSQQFQLLELLDEAREVDLTKTKTSISISSWIKLRLGDTFRVVIYHNQRHLVQAKKVLDLIPNK